MSVLDAKVENWERWVLDEGKEVVSLVRQKRRQEIDANRILHSQGVIKVNAESNRANKTVGVDSPNGPKTENRALNPHWPKDTGTRPKASASTTTTTTTTAKERSRSRSRMGFSGGDSSPPRQGLAAR